MSVAARMQSPTTVKRPVAPTLLRNLSRHQIMHIGNSLYELDLTVSSTIRKDSMVDDVAAAMQSVTGCGCSGEDVPCNPEIHRFSPDLFGPPQNICLLYTSPSPRD